MKMNPTNDLDEFVKYCMRMLAETHDPEVYIIMDNSVDSIDSAHVGVLTSCAMLSSQMGKKLHIKCNVNLKRLVDDHKSMKFID